MKPADLKAVQRMYNAILSISCLDTSIRGSAWIAARAIIIATDCLKEMNGDHTKLIQKAIGIGD